MTITAAADFQRLLRANAPNLFLGELLLVAGLLFLVAWLGTRRRGSSLLWLGIFALVYGFRLLARTATFRLGFDVPSIVWDHIAAALTYAIPLPVVLLARAMLPNWGRRENWILVGMGTFVACAIASDLILRQPDSANVPNNMLAVAFLVFLLARLFISGLPPSRDHVTAAYLFLDGSGRLMRYAAAGHPPMLRMAGGDKSVQEIEKNGLVLGFMEAASYEETEQTLEAGDRLLLYTDGLVEAANVADEPFGIERVKSVLAQASALSPEMAANALTSAMDAWSQQPAADDLTIIVVDFSN